MNNIHIKAPYNPHDAVDLSPLRIGGHTVARRQLPGTPRTQYLVMSGGQIAGQQISYPTVSDCDGHVRRFLDASDGRKVRAPSILAKAQGTLSERLVEMMRLEPAPLSIPQLVGAMKVSVDALSPILNKLVKNMRVTRAGEPGAHTYTAR